MAYVDSKIARVVQCGNGVFNQYNYEPDNGDDAADVQAVGYFTACRFRTDAGWQSAIIACELADGFFFMQVQGDEVSVAVIPSSPTAWGDITGTLSAQTDLQTALNGKQATLVSGTNIKTINSNSLLGAGDLVISASAAWGSITGTLSAQTDLQTALDGKVDENAAITGATKTKITYDAKGLVTAGADATTADIADSFNRRYLSDAEQVVLGDTSGINTGDETATTIGTKIVGTVALTIADSDYLAMITSSVAQAITWGNIKSILKTYFDGLYPSGSGSSTGTNTGDQTSIVGISGTKAQFDTACSDGNFVYVGDITGLTDGDKGDITVSASGATWTIDNGVVTAAKTSITGTPDGTKYLRDDFSWATVSGGSGLTQEQVEGLI